MKAALSSALAPSGWTWSGLLGLSLLGLGLTVTACGGSGEPPVAELRVEPHRLVLPYPGYREIRVDLVPTAPIESSVSPILFVHLLGEPGEVLRTFDHPLPATWRPGKRMRYPVRLFQSAMARPLPAGRYRLTVGLYEPGGGRWPLDFKGEEVDRHEYLVTEIEVPEAPANGPRFGFSGSWSEVEAGSDRQVLARRWLGGEGRIEASMLKPPGRLWLAVRIPPPLERGARVLGEGEAAPSVVVRSSCGDLEVAISGVGLHEVEIPVIAEEETTECSLVLEPSFYDQMEGSFERRACALEAIAWIGR